ncbi:MAG: cell division protein FtsA [Synergistaceae bacterium]
MFKRASGYLPEDEPELVVGLDLGTSKISVVVAEREYNSDSAQIIGMGQAVSSGIRKGMIVNLEQAVRSVKQAVNDAQNMVGQEIRNVTVSFGGGEITNKLSSGMVSLGRSPRAVTSLDIERAIEAAQANVSIPANQSILHTIPVEYSLDGNEGIEDPLGMTAMRLDIQLQSIIVPTTTIQNVLNCVERAGLEVEGFVLKPLTSALGVITPEESTAGAVVVDMGGGTTSIAVFFDGRCKYLGLVPIGGDHITNDVSSILKIPINKAEEIKREISIDPALNYTEDQNIEFACSSRDYTVSKDDLSEIVKSRIEELFDSLVRPHIINASVPMLPAGIILTGGVSKSEGLDSLLLNVMNLPIRVSEPLDVNKMPPGRNSQEYSSAAGIIRYIIEKERDSYRYMDNRGITKNISMIDQSNRHLVPEVSATSKVKDTAREIKEKTIQFSFMDELSKVFKDIF